MHLLRTRRGLLTGVRRARVGRRRMREGRDASEGGGSSSGTGAVPAPARAGRAAAAEEAATGRGGGGGMMATTVLEGPDNGFTFSPSTVTVNQGQTITLDNVSDAAHTFTVTGQGIDIETHAGQVGPGDDRSAPGDLPVRLPFPRVDGHEGDVGGPTLIDGCVVRHPMSSERGGVVGWWVRFEGGGTSRLAEMTAKDQAADPGSDELELQLERHRTELTAYAYRMLGSGFEAEDAVQEAFLRAWKSFDAVRGAILAALVAVQHRDERLSRHAGRQGAPGAPDGPRAGEIRGHPAARPAPRERVDPARPRRPRGARERRSLGGARVARVGPARVRRGAAAPAAAAAGGADPPRGPALEGVRGGRAARYLRRVGEQRAATRARDPRVRRDRRRRDPATRRRRAARAARPLRRRVRAVRHGVADVAPARGRHLVDAAVRDVAADPRRHPSRGAWDPGIGCRGSRLIAAEANGMPAFGQYKPERAGRARAVVTPGPGDRRRRDRRDQLLPRHRAPVPACSGSRHASTPDAPAPGPAHGRTPLRPVRTSSSSSSPHARCSSTRYPRRRAVSCSRARASIVTASGSASAPTSHATGPGVAALEQPPSAFAQRGDAVARDRADHDQHRASRPGTPAPRDRLRRRRRPCFGRDGRRSFAGIARLETGRVPRTHRNAERRRLAHVPAGGGVAPPGR